MKFYYFNSNPKTFGFNNVFHKTLFGHTINEKKNNIFIKPTRFNKFSLSPSNILGLKKAYNIKEIHMYDRIRGIEHNVLITDHINRSGLFFLRGRTPHEDFPMFPDMSKVYEKKSKLKKTTVQTLGPKRFKTTETQEGVVFSECCAITATLWHYVGVSVKCFGVLENKN
ncbi:hypothetical protein N9W06_01765 [Candidatus Marinimicrobia bacterium]|nr:hypothetical protein [Candidatus Neomarinimicrobiota bacterium]